MAIAIQLLAGIEPGCSLRIYWFVSSRPDGETWIVNGMSTQDKLFLR